MPAARPCATTCGHPAAGRFQNLFAVYDRESEPCKRRGCAGTIVRIVQAGRATYFCPRCQH